MPSTHDDSPGTTPFSIPRSADPGNPGNAARPSSSGPTPTAASTDRWLGVFMTDCMAAAGVDVSTAQRLADEMQPCIVAAFSTLARLERVGFVIDTNGGQSS